MSVTLDALARCFEGAVPAVIVTVAADGTPNVTYLSRVRRVDDERIALSNQFFSKTARNLAENPRADVLLIDPVTYDEFRLSLVYERTERRGPVFERLRDDIELVASLTGMQDVFTLRAADIYRVRHLEMITTAAPAPPTVVRATGKAQTVQLAELTARLGRCGELDTLVASTIEGLDDLLGYPHSTLLLLEADSGRLVTIASRGYPTEGVGSELRLGDGVIGMAAQRCAAVRVGNLRQMDKYTSTVRRSLDRDGAPDLSRAIPLPELSGSESQLAVPLMALGELVGVLAVDSPLPAAFDESDEAILSVVASVVGAAVVADRPEPEPVRSAAALPATGRPIGPATRVRHFAADGSIFFDDDYIIKGVAGRILWSLLRTHASDRRVEFTNKELRLDPSLELPEVRQNLESRLILLKRRLDEREAPVRITKTGRGRFHLEVGTELRLSAR